MTSESHKTSTHSSADHGGSRPNKQLDKEIRDMVSAITNRVTDIHKSGSIHHEDEDEHGVRIITLAGSNTGATLRSELDHENMNKSGGLHGGGPAFGDADGLSTYVNSNFQAVNNSLMMGGSYTTNDPGVHLDITDVVEPHGGHHGRPERRGLKGKKGKGKEKEKEKEKETFHSDQHDEQDED
ncbi:hypothetical protein ACFX13_039246 [Malus domestica]|uniref:uncharacterized protein n=1 Tax=Malus domestica TaxID=3750 RepID=UPI000499126B|nr:uncharacterized protein LOC103410000 [Malus domestica]